MSRKEQAADLHGADIIDCVSEGAWHQLIAALHLLEADHRRIHDLSFKSSTPICNASRQPCV